MQIKRDMVKTEYFTIKIRNDYSLCNAFNNCLKPGFTIAKQLL